MATKKTVIESAAPAADKKKGLQENLDAFNGIDVEKAMQDIIDSLLTGRGQEPAGIDHYHIRALGIGQDLMARGIDKGHHLLGIHLIFGAAKRNKRNFIHINKTPLQDLRYSSRSSL